MKQRLTQPIHISWLIAWSAVGIVVGVVVSQYGDQSQFSSLSWLLTSTALFGFVAWRRDAWMIGLAILAGVVLGLWRGSVVQSHLAVYENLIGRMVNVHRIIIEDVEKDKRNNLAIRLGKLMVNDQAVTGKVWVTIASDADLKRGDIVVMRGKLQQGFGNFPAVMYSAELLNAQRPEPGDIARRVRDWFADAVRVAIAEPEASLGIGYLVGQRRDLPPELDESLRIAGLTHIVVASGYNLTILVRLARRLFEKVSKYLSALASSTLIVSFIAVTGMSPSMSRAGLIAGLSLLAWYYGRKFHPLVLLPLAAAVTLLINPSYGWGDLGWQLSFAAFAGVMILAPLLQRYFFGKKKPGLVRQIMGETVAAFIVTLPILVYAFGYFSNVAILANLLVLPLVPLAMLFTFIAGIGALVLPGIAGLIGWPAELLLQYMTKVAQILASQDWSISEVTVSLWAVVIAYLGITAACIYMWRVTKYNLRDSNIVE